MRDVDLIAGVDEAGRGPLAGPVYAAAVIIASGAVVGLDDSKKLSEKRRQIMESAVKENAISWSVASASVQEIDEINILNASLLAMRRAIEGLKVSPAHVIVDGNRVPPLLSCSASAVVGGDGLHEEISAASILAKEERDRVMRRMAMDFPEYGFEKHKGYPTKQHMEALIVHGPCPHHRLTFGPVKRVLSR